MLHRKLVEIHLRHLYEGSPTTLKAAYQGSDIQLTLPAPQLSEGVLGTTTTAKTHPHGLFVSIITHITQVRLHRLECMGTTSKVLLQPNLTYRRASAQKKVLVGVTRDPTLWTSAKCKTCSRLPRRTT